MKRHAETPWLAMPRWQWIHHVITIDFSIILANISCIDDVLKVNSLHHTVLIISTGFGYYSIMNIVKGQIYHQDAILVVDNIRTNLCSRTSFGKWVQNKKMPSLQTLATFTRILVMRKEVLLNYCLDLPQLCRCLCSQVAYNCIVDFLANMSTTNYLYIYIECMPHTPNMVSMMMFANHLGLDQWAARLKTYHVSTRSSWNFLNVSSEWKPWHVILLFMVNVSHRLCFVI